MPCLTDFTLVYLTFVIIIISLLISCAFFDRRDFLVWVFRFICLMFLVITATTAFLELSHLVLDGKVAFPKESVLEVVELVFGGRTIFLILFDDLGFADFLQQRRI